MLDNIDNGLYLAIGQQGSGKTALITSLAVRQYQNDRRLILSNYNLKVPHLKINYNVIIQLVKSVDLVKSVELIKMVNGENKVYTYNIAQEYENITGEKPLSNNDYLNNNIIMLDELHTYFDAYDFIKQDNRIMSSFMSQLRKRNTLVLATTQYFKAIDNRIRKQTKYIFDIRQEKGKFIADLSAIDGYYFKPIKKLELYLQPYFKYYDTHEIIGV